MKMLRRKKRKYLKTVVSILLLMLAACEAESRPVITPTISPLQMLTCNELAIRFDSTLACAPVDDALVLQNNRDAQVTVTFNNITLTFFGTVYLAHKDDSLTIAAVEDSAVVSIPGEARALSGGMMAVILLQTDTLNTRTIDTIEPVTDRIITLIQRATVPFEITPQIIQTPTLPAESPIERESAPTPCPAPDGWYDFYTVTRGDTLSGIAAQYAVSLDDLQTANCLTDINRLQPGDLLRVPGGDLNAAAFTAQSTTLAPGTCTLLEWAVTNVRAVALDGEPVPATGSYNACPTLTQTYILRVLYNDGAQVEYPLTLIVE